MFRLHKNKSDKFGEKYDFKFSNIQALQVPKGWDRLSLSLISSGTGKTVAKSGKASARNGTCRWSETFSESIWIPQANASKETEEYTIKIVVAMGSSKSSVLGEASVNLASYISSKISVPISLTLKKCTGGTILQLKLQCLTPRGKLRDEKWKDANSDMEESSIEYDEMENKSDVSDGTFTRSRGSSSSNNLDSTYQAGEPCSRLQNMSFSPTGSRNSFDSLEGSIGRDSPRSNSSGISNNLIGRQDSISSQSSSPYSSHSFNDASRSNQSIFNSKASGYGNHPQNQEDLRVPRPVASSPLRNTGSSKDLLEAAEVKIEDLHAESRMWEQNARKLMTDMEKLQKEYLDQSTHQKNLEKELAVSRAECDGLKVEIEQLKILVEESKLHATPTENPKFQGKDMDSIACQFEDEINFQNESNANLAVQLKKTQESNIELLSILQELEETIEKQKKEIDNLSKSKSEIEGVYNHKVEESTQNSIKKNKDTSCELNVDNRELNAELKQEDKKKLDIQLQHLQESQKNMERTIRFLERSLEEKNKEIETERSSKTQSLTDFEAMWRARVAQKEDKIVHLEEQLSAIQDAQQLKDMGSACDERHNLIKEIDILKRKVQELERDCNELTDENLELLFKLKESKKDLINGDNSPEFLSHECSNNSFRFTSESEVSELKYQMFRNEEELKKNSFTEGYVSDHLQVQSLDGNTSTDLELQLQAFKDRASYLDDELCKCRSIVAEQESKIVALQLELNCGKGTESEYHLAVLCSKHKNSESKASTEMSKLLSQLDDQVQLSLGCLRKQQPSLDSSTNSGCCDISGKSEVLMNNDLLAQKKQAKSILNSSIQLRKLLEEKLNFGDDELQSDDVQNELISRNLNEDVPVMYAEGPGNSKVENGSVVPDTGNELMEKTSETNKPKTDNLQKKEFKAQRHCQRELDTQISDLQNGNSGMEESTKMTVRESTTASICLDDLRNEIRVLNDNLDRHVSANKILEQKSSELESSKHELEVHLCELEKENVQLSVRISGLEAQLRYLTDERESCRMELENSESHAVKHQDEVRRVELEMEAQKFEMTQKLQDMQKRWLAVQEECEFLKIANPKLQATAEGLIEECSLLQKSNSELRNQKMKLHEHSTILEAELRESEKGFCDMSRKVEALEDKYSSLLDEIASKEKALNLELDVLLQENQKQQRVLEDGLLNQRFLEKTPEVENPQREVTHLTKQISETPDGKGRRAEASGEVPHLEAALEEVRKKLKISEGNLETLQIESQIKVKQLTDELVAAKQNQEVLMADHEKLLDMLEDVKSNEEKHRSATRGCELKLKASEYERLQLAEEISSLKVQLEKTAQLQDELPSLNSSLNEAKLEKERIEASFQILSADYEQLQSERSSLSEKISTCERALSELDDCKRKKVALQEKILRLEGDLTAREALASQEAVLKNELAQIRRENSQLQRKIKYLEEEKEEFIKRAETLEYELKQMREVKQDLAECARSLPHPSSHAIHPELPLLEQGKKNQQINEQPYVGSDRNQRQVDYKNNYDIASSEDPMSKIQALETELAEALEANDMYKAQLKSLLSRELIDPSDTHTKLTSGGGQETIEGHDCDKSSLEAELKDLRERYFHMSLKYAEVEDEREQLLMKLKAANTKRRWFA